ncbi:porin (plasmid) [Edwardsiella tarda]|uniref:porin n=1 Tax=Edwardsiella tarda TaxID=636 RepID=UPI002444E081|nr:porin [Edwardsiella tarda]WGE31050.1 porin [Edwardsiella tarda]
MKHNALSLAILISLASSGVANAVELYHNNGNKLDLYGKVNARHFFSSNKSDNVDGSYARFGFKGETQINNDLTGYGQWEANMPISKESGDSAAIKTRLGFAGLKYKNFGSIDYGRNYGVLYDVESFTDVLPVFGGDTYSHTDNFMTGRSNSLITYRNNGFFGLVDGLDFALQYQGKNSGSGSGSDGSSNIEQEYQNGDGFGLSTSYDFGNGITASAAFSASNRTNAQVNPSGYLIPEISIAKGSKAQAWATGLKYDANNIYIATMYSETLNMTPYGGSPFNGRATGTSIANKTQNIEIVTQYNFDFGLQPSIAYLQSKGKQLGASSNIDKDLVKYIDVGAKYTFNKNMATYIDYKINLLNGNDDFYKNNGIPTDNVVGLGLVYQF